MEQLFGAIPTVLSGLEANENIAEAVVLATWQRCAGDLLRERTLPVKFAANRLVVAVSDQTWQRHLEELSPQMLVKLNASLAHGRVKFIEFRIDAKAIAAADRPERLSCDEKAAPMEPSLVAAARSIADEGLREQFLSAASAYLNRQK